MTGIDLTPKKIVPMMVERCACGHYRRDTTPRSGHFLTGQCRHKGCFCVTFRLATAEDRRRMLAQANLQVSMGSF